MSIHMDSFLRNRLRTQTVEMCLVHASGHYAISTYVFHISDDIYNFQSRTNLRGSVDQGSTCELGPQGPLSGVTRGSRCHGGGDPSRASCCGEPAVSVWSIRGTGLPADTEVWEPSETPGKDLPVRSLWLQEFPAVLQVSLTAFGIDNNPPKGV